VHKHLICFYSPYFDAAFNGTFKEGEVGALELAKVTKSSFRSFLDWLYFGRLPEYILYHDESGDDQSIGKKETGEDGGNPYYPMSAYKLYVFADRYNVPELRKDLMEVIRSVWKAEGEYYPSNEETTWLFNALPESSALCTFMVDLYAYRFEPTWDNDVEIKARSQPP